VLLPLQVCGLLCARCDGFKIGFAERFNVVAFVLHPLLSAVVNSVPDAANAAQFAV
jgi:hypothetical protein